MPQLQHTPDTKPKTMLPMCLQAALFWDYPYRRMAYTFTHQISHNTHSDCKTHALVKTVAQLSKNT